MGNNTQKEKTTVRTYADYGDVANHGAFITFVAVAREATLDVDTHLLAVTIAYIALIHV